MSFVRLLSGAVLALLWNGTAAAEPAPNQTPALASPSAAASVPVALSADEMSATHAGSDTTVNVVTRQQLSGTTSGNSVVAGTLTSGAVAFSPQALNGFSGVGNFVINTGANNTLQGAINISVVTTPGVP
jgi:hypothetical protein